MLDIIEIIITILLTPTILIGLLGGAALGVFLSYFLHDAIVLSVIVISTLVGGVLCGVGSWYKEKRDE